MPVKKQETAAQKLLAAIESGDSSAKISPGKQHTQKQKNVVGLLRFANKLLMIGCVAAVGWLFYEGKSGIEFLGQADADSNDIFQTASPMDSKKPLPPARPLSDYLASVERRNIFQPYEELQIKSGTPVTADNRRIVEETVHLRLVGVSWLDTVESASVMIEDTTQKLTHFLRQGEKIGNVTVKTIYADSVELGLDNEEILIQYEQENL